MINLRATVPGGSPVLQDGFAAFGATEGRPPFVVSFLASEAWRPELW